MFFSRFNDINLFLSIVSECSVPPGVGPQGGLGRRRPPWLLARSQSVVTRMAIKILIMKIYSRFKGTDLSRSMLANFVMPQRRDRGAMAAMGRRRPPWSGYIFLPSFRLANHVSEVCQPKNQQKTNLNIWLNGTFEVPILCEFIGRRCMCRMVKQIRHLGVGGAR